MKELPPGWGINQVPKHTTKLPLATQLFTVADMLSKDLRGTLKLVAAAGYDGVEFAGGFKHTAQEVKFALDDAGLQIAGWHTPWAYLSDDNINATITYNKVLGNQFIIVPWMPDETFKTQASCLQFAKELTTVADKLAMHGMVTGFHNHTLEFKPTQDSYELPWDIIAQNTPSHVIMQNDIGNGMAGGADMIAMLEKYPGRATTVHMKPFTEGKSDTFFDDPDCNIDWQKYFTCCRNQAGVRWYIVEYLNNERYPGNPIAAITDAAKWFRSI